MPTAPWLMRSIARGAAVIFQRMLACFREVGATTSSPGGGPGAWLAPGPSAVIACGSMTGR